MLYYYDYTDGLIRLWEVFALVYLYDILVFSGSAARHIDHGKHVWTPSRDARATMKLKTCSFFTEWKDEPGQVIRPRRSEIASHTMDAIKGLKASRNFKELNLLFSLCKVMRRFLMGFARVASPLIDNLQKHLPFNFFLHKKGLGAM